MIVTANNQNDPDTGIISLYFPYISFPGYTHRNKKRYSAKTNGKTKALPGPSSGAYPVLKKMEKSNYTGDALILSLSSGNMDVLDNLYDRYRDDFLRWAAQRFQLNRDDLLDAWHDTMIMFYEQVRDKKLTTLTCEVKTYLFTIGYRRLIKIHYAVKKIDLKEDFDANENIDDSINISEAEERSEQQRKAMIKAVEQLPEKSRRILSMRYLEGKSIPRIMEEIGYESENAVSVTLSRALKKLKELLTDRMND